jgi:hypothetical protein
MFAKSDIRSGNLLLPRHCPTNVSSKQMRLTVEVAQCFNRCQPIRATGTGESQLLGVLIPIIAMPTPLEDILHLKIPAKSTLTPVSWEQPTPLSAVRTCSTAVTLVRPKHTITNPYTGKTIVRFAEPPMVPKDSITFLSSRNWCSSVC